MRTYSANLTCQGDGGTPFRLKWKCRGRSAGEARTDAERRVRAMYPKLAEVKVGRVTWLRDCNGY